MARIGRARARLNLGKTAEAVVAGRTACSAGICIQCAVQRCERPRPQRGLQALFRGNGTTVAPAFRG